MRLLDTLYGAFALATSAAIVQLMLASPASAPLLAATVRDNAVKVFVRHTVDGVPMAGHGSGVVVSRYHIITCYHVAGRAESIMVKDVQGRSATGTVVRTSPLMDLVLVRLDKNIGNPVSAIVDHAIGEQVVTVGSPWSHDFLITAGVTSGRQEMDLVSDVVINQGNSGGGLFNRKGQLIGIARAISTRLPFPIYQGYSIFVPASAVRDLIQFHERETKIRLR